MPISFRIHADDRTWGTRYGAILLVLALTQVLFVLLLSICQVSAFKFRMPNVTMITMDLYDDIPYEDCLCSIIQTEECLTHLLLKIARVLPLILFVVQVYAIREHISFSGNHMYFLANLYWIVSTFGFFGILIIINQSSPYYANTATILDCTGFLLFCLVAPSVLSID